MLHYDVARSGDGQDVARAKDWLTALSPLILMMVVNYHWSAVWTVLTATAGYLATTVCWQWLRLLPCRVAPALLCGVLVACCFPSAVPLWLPAAAGVAAAVFAVMPSLINYWSRREMLSCPVYVAPLAGYLLLRLLLPAYFIAFAQPMMWTPVDGVAGATPLASLGHPDTATALPQLFWGFAAGSMGGGPAPAVLLGGVYLLLRRRLHWIPVVTMSAVVVLLSWCIWDMPLYALLGGGTLLAAVLLGDEGFSRVGWKGHLAAGVLAGVATVLCRLWWGTDGAAVGVLLAALLLPPTHLLYHWLAPYLRVLLGKIKKSEK